MTRKELESAPVTSLYDMMEAVGFEIDASEPLTVKFIKGGEVVALRGLRQPGRDRGGRAFMIDALAED